MVGAVREPDHGQQAFHAHALSLTDLLDENRLLPVGQVFGSRPALSQQLQRAPADRDLDVGSLFSRRAARRRRPARSRQACIRASRFSIDANASARPGRIREPAATAGASGTTGRAPPPSRVFPAFSPRASPWIRRASVVSILATRPARGFGGRLMRFQPSGRPPPPPSASTPRAPARVSAAPAGVTRRSTP